MGWERGQLAGVWQSKELAGKDAGAPRNGHSLLNCRMDTGEWLTRGTVWLALSLYVASEMAAARRGRELSHAARWVNTAGGAAFFAHVASAFHFYHHWSHTAAYEDTARQTAEFSGWNWGGGLYINYAFALVWLGEVAWSWANPNRYLQRPNWMTWFVRGFFLFMMFNGAVVFVHNAVRWFGLVLCLVLLVCWWRAHRNTVAHV